MKIYHTEDVAGTVLVAIAVILNAIYDYFNSSTIQAVINAICAFLATLLLKFLVEKIRKKRKE